MSPIPSTDGGVAIVTGAARGLGREIAANLATAGFRVAAFDLGDLTETAAEVERLSGAKLLGLKVDVTDEASVTDALATVSSELGPVAALVNNAGRWIDLERRPFWEIPVDEYDAVMEVNARSVFVVSKVVSGPMREAGDGRIVNITSNVVAFGMPFLIHYVTSKAAVVGLTRSMATELAPHGVRVNAVAPGLVGTTPAREGMPADFFETVEQTQLLQEPVLASDIAGAVGYLCGPGGRMLTGQIITVNGGATMAAI